MTIYAMKAYDGEAKNEEQGRKGDQALKTIAAHPWLLLYIDHIGQ